MSSYTQEQREVIAASLAACNADDEQSLFQAQLIGLMEGEGASEDHADVKAALATLPLSQQAVTLLHAVLVNALKPAPADVELERLRELAATCYAGLGAECNLPEAWLDVLNAAANGEPFSVEGLLPFTAAPAQPAAPQGVAVGVVRWAAGIEGSQLEVRWKDGEAPPAGTQVYAQTTTAQAAPAAGAVAGPVDDIDAIALARYKVVPSHDSMFHRFAVVAGDGKQQLYLGRETECQNMARKFAGAFLDGAFYQSHAVAPTPAAQADSQPAPPTDYPALPEPSATGLGDEYEAFDRTGRAMGNAYETILYFKADQMRAYVDADRAARAPADSVLEDAALSKCSINRYCHANMCLETDADHETDCPQGHAARKQGGGHV